MTSTKQMPALEDVKEVCADLTNLVQMQNASLSERLASYNAIAASPELLSVALCRRYDVTVYLVTGEGPTAGCPQHEIGKYFVATNVGDFSDGPLIPLAATEIDAYCLAAKILRLKQQYLRELEAGDELPSRSFPSGIPALGEYLARVISETRAHETMNAVELGLKLSEENGEFAESILVELGKLPHKTLKEPAFGEAADIVICVVATLAKLYPALSPQEVVQELEKWVTIKQEKYEARLHEKG